MKSKEELAQDAEDHWKYTKALINILVELGGFLYKQAYIHGYKHGSEDKDG